jgi:U3 small nucleolar RNA-associated protein 11
LDLLKELGARLEREKLLRYSERELELQRLLMGKGARQKLQSKERLDDAPDEEDEDEIDSRKTRKSLPPKPVDEATYRPRVYKWKRQRQK